MRFHGLAAVATALFSSTAGAQLFYPLQQTRWLDATVQVLGYPAHSDADTGPAAGEWLGDASTSTLSPDGFVKLQATATQFSLAGPDQMDVYGATEVLIGASNGYPQSHVEGLMSAAGDCRFRFAVAQRLSVNLTGAVAAEFHADASIVRQFDVFVTLTARLRAVAGAEIYRAEISLSAGDWNPSSFDQLVSNPVAFAVELAPGVYDLEVSTSVDAPRCDSGDTETGIRGATSHVITLSATPAPPPAPLEGDLDSDGDVDLVDFGRLQDSFTGPLP